MPANMYPSSLSKETLSNPSRQAEVEVYNKLREQLNDSFHVFYNCDWHDTTKRGVDEEGEADFVLAHETYGYLVIEVKGGIISRDEGSQKWYSSERRSGQVHEIKNPVKQARTSSHYILNKLKNIHGESLGFIRRKHCAVFPHSGRPRLLELGADMPIEIFAFLEDMPKLGNKLIQILMRDPDGAKTKYSSLGSRGIKSIHDLFSKGFKLEPSLVSRVRSCEFQIEELTNKQKECLKSLDNNKKVMVSGAAGTGKTSLAIEKAIGLNNDGFEVLYLCHNEALAKYLEKRFTGFNNISVCNYFKFCSNLSKKYQISLLDRRDHEYWEHLALVPLEALSIGGDELLVDAVIIDEGQDFNQDWIDILMSFLRDHEKGLFYFFYDDNQKIYNSDKPVPKLEGAVKYGLYKNIRNSKPICEISSLFYQGKELEAGGPEGLDIELVAVDKNSRDRILEKYVNKLVNNEDIEIDEIAILTGKSLNTFDGLSFKNLPIKSANDIDAKGIVVDNIYRFKGLEKEVVILIDLQEKIDNTALLYVGTSRARSHLVIMDKKETIDALIKLRGQQAC